MALTPRRTNPLALAVLTCLFERPMHPYEVAQTLRHRAKHESIKLNYGSLYNVVESLERQGLIEARETVREGRRPERTIYAITERGTREMTDWLSELVSSPAEEYPQFVAALSLMAALPPNEVVALLRQRAETLEIGLATRRAAIRAAVDAGLARLFVIEDEYRIAMQESELAYIQALAKDIETGQLDGLELWKTMYASEP